MLPFQGALVHFLGVNHEATLLTSSHLLSKIAIAKLVFWNSHWTSQDFSKLKSNYLGCDIGGAKELRIC